LFDPVFTISRSTIPPRRLNQAVGQRRFAMVDVGDNGEITDVIDQVRGHGG
jgi:hypothetical protein